MQKIVRPWGKMWKLFHTKGAWLKFIRVYGRTSLQAHRHRTEWYFGLYKVLPMEKHRLAKGLYFEFVKGKADEDDVIRYEDDYERTSPESKVVMVSGGFDPVHIGHLRMFKEAKKLGDRLVVVINSDEWLQRKKGKNFMHQDERAELIKELNSVDEVYVLESDRDDVIEALEKFKPHIFANGGDRDKKNAADPSSSLYKDIKKCEQLRIEMIFNVGGDKVRSSSDLLEEYHQNSK